MMIGLRQELPGQSRHGSAACRSPGTAACRGARGCPHHTAAGAVLRGAARKPAAWPCCAPQPHTRPSKYLCHMLGKVYFSLQICIPCGISTGKTFQHPRIHQMEHLWVWADAHVGSGANTCCSHCTGMLGQRAFLGQFAKCTARSTKVLAKMFLV